MNIKTLTAAALVALGAAAGMNAAVEEPDFRKINAARRGGSLEFLTRNGKWAVGFGKSPIYELGYHYPRLYNTETGEMKWLYDANDEMNVPTAEADGVTEDGSIVCGQYNLRPAIWRASTGKWEILPLDATDISEGWARYITPDGKYAVGSYMESNIYHETIVAWDLSGEKPVQMELPGMPLGYGKTGEYYGQMRASAISDDGNVILGTVAFSFTTGETPEGWSFMYDRSKASWQAFGWTISDDYQKFTRNPEGPQGASFFWDRDNLVVSASGGLHLLNLKTGEMKFLMKGGGHLGRDGMLYMSTGSAPICDWSVKMGDYWYDWKTICRQEWGIDWKEDIVKDDYGYSGNFMGVSQDGLTILANDYSSRPYDTYLLRLPRPLVEILPGIDLLDNYYVTPREKASFSMMRTVKVTFDRNIEVLGKNAGVQLLDAQGNVVANSIRVGLEAGSTSTLSIAFRDRRLDEGVAYDVVIPAGTVCLPGDRERSNSEIRIRYTGRPDRPVEPVRISPESGIKLEKINASSNPVSITFDTEISAPEENGGSVNLYRLNEAGQREFVSKMNGSVTGSQLVVFPLMEQQLAFGSEYEIVVDANTVCDLSGVNGNESFTIKYTGSYIPENTHEKVIFSEDFSAGVNGRNMMLYDGDQQEPNAAMKAWTFTSELPWIPARDAANYDYAAASHSMYESPGQSDDWMVTRRLWIPDESGVLTFQSQSYLKSKEDRLKVIVYASDDVYTSLSKTIVDKMRYEGEVIYDQIQSPGKSEEDLAGDWTDNMVLLKKYAGKNIYIAFVNDNRNQSAVFVDNIKVERDLKFSVNNLTATNVVSLQSIPVKLLATVMSQADIYSSYEFTLLDSEGKEISKVAESGLDLRNGWSKMITFPAELPLEVGKENGYTIRARFDEIEIDYQYSVKDLAMQTVKRVVVEKFTGQTCQNCPQGIVAMEKIEKDFGDQVVPVALHSYQGDTFDNPKSRQLAQFLGMSAAPSGRVNRGDIISPLGTDGKGNGSFTNYDPTVPSWYDNVVSELAVPAEANIDVASYYNTDRSKIHVRSTVTYALDMENVNANIFTVILEDGLRGNQSNNVYGSEDPIFGDWGKGGKYGQPSVPYVYNDVVRDWEGTTANGTGGYIPSTVEGGKPYVAEFDIDTPTRLQDKDNVKIATYLINANSGRILNAAVGKIGASGVENVEGLEAETRIVVRGGEISVLTSGAVSAAVYSMDGRMIGAANGIDTLSLNLDGYKGVAVVRVADGNGVKVVKVML